MKVLLVSALPPPVGGISVWTERYLAYCEEHQIKVSLVNIALNGARGAKVNDHMRILDEIVRTTRVLCDMNKQLNNERPSVVHMNTSCGQFGIYRDLLCVKAAKKRCVPVVLHIHCDVESRVHGKIGRWALKKMADMATNVLVLNSTSLSYMKSLVKTKTDIIPNFINGDFLSKEHIIREIINEIVFVGHVQITKGSKEILEAAAQLPNIHFTLIGPVADEIAALPCPKNVSLMGPKNPSEVKQYLLNADLYLFPSYTEGFSLSLTEAMSTGLPAIATDVGANRDMLGEKGGIIIPIQDSGAIVKAIYELQDKDKRQRMSEWEIQKVRNCYLTEKVMEKILGAYKKIEKAV